MPDIMAMSHSAHQDSVGNARRPWLVWHGCLKKYRLLNPFMLDKLLETKLHNTRYYAIIDFDYLLNMEHQSPLQTTWHAIF